MKKQLLMCFMYLGAISFMVSCKNDDVENIILKQTGNVNTTFLYGEQPIKNTKVSLYNGDNWGLLEILTTDENGSVNLQNFIEGNYNFVIEINEPHYAEIIQEFQVISGSTKTLSVQTKDHKGALSVSLVDNFSSQLIKEDLKIGVAVVPNSPAFKKALNHKEILALAGEIKFFDTSGKLDFNNIPTGYYNIYKINVEKDSILSTWRSNYHIASNRTRIDTYSINLINEVISSKPQFTVDNMLSVNSTREELTDSPFLSINFMMEGNQQKIKFNLENDLVFTGNLHISTDGSYSVSSIESSNINFALQFQTNWPSRITFTDGKLRLNASLIRIVDYSVWPQEVRNFYDARITLQ